MELGFGSLIKEFEKRLGKLLTNLLVWAIFILIISWCVKSIVAIYMSGINFWSAGGQVVVWGLLKIVFVHVILIITTVMICYGVCNWIKERTITAITDCAEEKAKNLENLGREKVNEIRKLGAYEVKRLHSMIETDKE